MSQGEKTRTALVGGATGLIGGLCVDLLLKDEAYSKVVGLVRRPIPLAHSKFQLVSVDFENLPSVRDQIRADDVFLCLGTTNSLTTDRDKYYKIDVQYPAEIAAIAKTNGAKTVILVSSLGANAGSGQWYLRFKGEIEEKVTQLGFESTSIFRPSLIAGRTGNRRFKERLALATFNFWSFLFSGASRRFLPLNGELIAQAMVLAAKQNRPGVRTFDRLGILTMLGQKP